ncbi:MAG: hypothetical protein H6Q74_1492 [Firmicutes bacterium]|nr:hypothetical protein [Bacillota bacterium]
MADFFSQVFSFEGLGIVASILSIPLALFFNKLNNESKYLKIRRSIVCILLCKLGESKTLTTFEIQSVINSKINETKLNIRVGEIIDDLVTEVIGSPLLDIDKKENILTNLREIYSGEKLVTIGNKNDIPANNLGQYIEKVADQTNVGSNNVADFKTRESDNYIGILGKRKGSTSDEFAVTVTIIVIIFYAITPNFEQSTISQAAPFKLYIIIGAIASLLAIMANNIIEKITRKSTEINGKR